MSGHVQPSQQTHPSVVLQVHSSPFGHVSDHTVQQDEKSGVHWVIHGEKDCATNPLDHTVTVSSKDGSPVIVSIKVLDQGGISRRSNSTSAPDIKIVFSSP